jgi:acyl carrier protein
MTDSIATHRLIEIVDEILACGPVGLDETFAELGGDSIQAVQILVACGREFETDLPLHSLTPATTMRELLDRVSAGRDGTARSPVPVPAPAGSYRPTPRQEALYQICRAAPDSPMYNVPVALWIDGTVDSDRLRSSVRRLVERYAALRTVFHVTADGLIECSTWGLGPATGHGTARPRALRRAGRPGRGRRRAARPGVRGAPRGVRRMGSQRAAPRTGEHV